MDGLDATCGFALETRSTSNAETEPAETWNCKYGWLGDGFNEDVRLHSGV